MNKLPVVFIQQSRAKTEGHMIIRWCQTQTRSPSHGSPTSRLDGKMTKRQSRAHSYPRLKRNRTRSAASRLFRFSI